MALPVLAFWATFLFYASALAQFQVLDPSIVNTTAATLSTACLNALQGTVNCDPYFQSVAASDNFAAIDDEIYDSICNANCSSSLASYHSAVSSACSGQPQPWSGLPATYFGDVYWATYNLSCLADPTTGLSCMSYFNTVSANYTTDMSATSLPPSVLCSPCVLAMYQVLQGTAYSYYDSAMAVEWSTIQSKCNVSYPTQVQQNPTNITNIPGFAPANYSTPPCLSGSTYLVVSGDDCTTISQKQNVSTGALIGLNSLFADCSNLIAGATLCLPQACRTYTVQSGDTCEGIMNSAGINFVQLTAWNPTINSYCTNLVTGQEICVGQTGQAWNGTTIAGATATQTAVYATTTAPVPSNLAYGTTTNCGRYYVAQQGDNCGLIAVNNTISIDLFEQINPSINANCTNLVAGLSYCVFPEQNWNNATTTATATTTSTYITAPAPTASGATTQCYQWHVVASGDYCGLLEDEYGITFDELQFWNPSLNSACTNLILGDAYCVDGSVSSPASSSAIVTPTSTPGSSGSVTPTPTPTPTSTVSTPPSTTSSVAIPGPTQSGITTSCTQYYLVQSGDTCYAITTEYGITLDQFEAWNPAVGTSCNIWSGYAYCVAI